MNYNYDPNQPQYNTQYQAPLYEQKPAPDATGFFVMSIIGLALSVTGISAIAGLILSIIAMSKAKKFVEDGGILAGKAKAGKILAAVGLGYGIFSTIMSILAIIGSIIYLFFIFGMIGMTAGTPDYYYY